MLAAVKVPVPENGVAPDKVSFVLLAAAAIVNVVYACDTSVSAIDAALIEPPLRFTTTWFSLEPASVPVNVMPLVMLKVVTVEFKVRVLSVVGVAVPPTAKVLAFKVPDPLMAIVLSALAMLLTVTAPLVVMMIELFIDNVPEVAVKVILVIPETVTSAVTVWAAILTESPLAGVLPAPQEASVHVVSRLQAVLASETQA